MPRRFVAAALLVSSRILLDVGRGTSPLHASYPGFLIRKF